MNTPRSRFVRHPTNAMQAQIRAFFARAGTARKIQIPPHRTHWPVRHVPESEWSAITARARQVLSAEAIRVRKSLELFDRLMGDVYGDF